jgi:hypothetical protein
MHPIARRAREPSTWAGVAALSALYVTLEAGILVAHIVGGVAGLLALVLPSAPRGDD